MSKEANIIGRVIHVGKSADGKCRVMLMTGDQEFEMTWADAPPSLGEVYCLTPGNHPKILRQIACPEAGAWSVEGDAMRWRKNNTAGQTRMDALKKRHTIRRAVRDYLDSEGFIELDCPLLVRGTTPDAAITSFRVDDRYMSTSTELQMRRLQVGGFDQIYTLTQNFRKGEGEGSTHNPEFTMLEWVRVGQALTAVEEDTAQLTWLAHRALGGEKIHTWQGRAVNLEPPWDRAKMADIITKFTGAAMPDYSLSSMQKAVQAAGLTVHKEWAEDRIFLFSILIDHLQQFLGFDRPVIVYDWPAFQTSSALEKDGDELTERSEAYICGLELCNGFLSLTEYAGQKTAFQKQLDRRKVEGKDHIEIDDAYMEAVRQGLPQDSGMALGFDRLVMLLTDRPDIRSVLALAWDEL